MNQQFEIQLQVIQRALGEVILPALKDADKHVIEQLHLSLAAIGFMQQRLPRARRYYRSTLQRYVAMASAVAELLKSDADGLESLIADGQSVLNAPACTDADLRIATGALRAKITAMVEMAHDATRENALDALIMEHSEAILIDDRTWCVPLGFELRPQDLPRPVWDH